MTGRVVEPAPPGPHRCSPGWSTLTLPLDSPLRQRGISEVADSPTAWRYPPGTVWRCDDCAREWVSTRRGVPVNAPGVIRWRRHRPLMPVALFLVVAVALLIAVGVLVATGVLR